MLKAGALFYAIVIAVLVAMLSGSLILSAYFTKTGIDSSVMRHRMNTNAMSGIEYLLVPANGVIENEVMATDLFGSGMDSVLLEKRSWGVYEVALSRARWRGSEVKLAAITGGTIDEGDRFALWLADQDRPLSLAGNTMIKGNAYLPKAGVQRAYIEGQSYAGEKMVFGNVFASERTIPQFDQTLLSKLKDILAGKAGHDSICSAIEDDSLVNSFFNRSVLIHSSQKMILDGKHISGNVIIISSKEIVVRKSSFLRDVLLAAPVIRIEDEFTGSVQAFASDSLLTGKKCDLLYPSSLAIIRNGHSPDHVFMSVGEGSKIKGCIAGLQETYDIRKSLLISVDKGAVITGTIYSTGLLDLKGIVNGSVIATRLLLRTPSSVYENHLLNAVIDMSSLPAGYGGPVMEKSNKAILKWVN